MPVTQLKAAMTWAGFGGVILDLVSPWLISYVSPVFVLTMLTGDLLMMLSFLVMMTIPLYEMWILRQPLMAGKRGEETLAFELLRPSNFCRGQRSVHPEPKIEQILGFLFASARHAVNSNNQH